LVVEVGRREEGLGEVGLGKGVGGGRSEGKEVVREMGRRGMRWEGRGGEGREKGRGRDGGGLYEMVGMK